MPKHKAGLSPKMEMFCVHYIGDANMNASKAARLAGYSERTSDIKAAQLMKDERIQRRIHDEIEARKERLRLDADDVLLMIMEQAQLDFSDFATWTKGGSVTFKTPEELGNKTRFVKRIKQTKKNYSGFEETETEFELMDKQAAINLLFKHFGLGAPIEIDESVPFAQTVALALEMVRNVATDDDSSKE